MRFCYGFTCIQRFVCARTCLPVAASLGSLRSPRSAFWGLLSNVLFQPVLKHEKPIKTTELLMLAKNIVEHNISQYFPSRKEVSKPQKPKTTFELEIDQILAF